MIALIGKDRDHVESWSVDHGIPLSRIYHIRTPADAAAAPPGIKTIELRDAAACDLYGIREALAARGAPDLPRLDVQDFRRLETAAREWFRLRRWSGFYFLVGFYRDSTKPRPRLYAFRGSVPKYAVNFRGAGVALTPVSSLDGDLEWSEIPEFEASGAAR